MRLWWETGQWLHLRYIRTSSTILILHVYNVQWFTGVTIKLYIWYRRSSYKDWQHSEGWRVLTASQLIQCWACTANQGRQSSSRTTTHLVHICCKWKNKHLLWGHWDGHPSHWPPHPNLTCFPRRLAPSLQLLGLTFPSVSALPQQSENRTAQGDY